MIFGLMEVRTLGLAFGVLKYQAALGAFLKCVWGCGKGAVGCYAVRAMTIEMDYVIEVRVCAEVLAELVERWWAQKVDMCGEAFVLNEVDERAGDGAETDVAFIGAGDDEQDVDAVLWEAGERGWILDFVDAAFDLAFVGEVVCLGIVERFPGPGEGVRIVGTDLENAGLVEPR